MYIEDKGDSVEITESYLLEGKPQQKRIRLNMNKIGETNLDTRINQRIESISYRKNNKIYREYFQITALKKTKLKYKVIEKYEMSKKKKKITLKVNGKVVSTSKQQFSSMLNRLPIFNYKIKKVFRLKE